MTQQEVFTRLIRVAAVTLLGTVAVTGCKLGDVSDATRFAPNGVKRARQPFNGVDPPPEWQPCSGDPCRVGDPTPLAWCGSGVPTRG